MSGALKLNYNSDEARAALKDVIKNLPSESVVFLIGGAVRNGLFQQIHDTTLPQRDYDQVITSGSKQYTEYLRQLGYQERPYPDRQDEQVVYCRPLNDRASAGDSYANWLVFDLHTVDGTTIAENIRRHAGFTINGCAVNLRDIFSQPWKDAVIEVLPTAIDDIKNKKLRINPEGYKYMPSNFYAMLRFISAGFSAPTNEEIQLLLHELPRLEHGRFERNVQKVWSYVGGEAKARSLVRELGITIDVFSEYSVRTQL